MNKHSPGPWKYDPKIDRRYDSITGEPRDQRYDWIRDADGTVVGSVWRSETREADAALIATAPRLLQCLRELVDRCAAIPPDQKTQGFVQEINDAFDAIAKAEGQS